MACCYTFISLSPPVNSHNSDDLAHLSRQSFLVTAWLQSRMIALGLHIPPPPTSHMHHKLTGGGQQLELRGPQSGVVSCVYVCVCSEGMLCVSSWGHDHSAPNTRICNVPFAVPRSTQCSPRLTGWGEGGGREEDIPMHDYNKML